MSHHLEAREIIESQIGKSPNDINGVPVLSTLYGPSSLVCHLVRPVDAKTFDAYFLIGQNICGPGARPPMFDSLTVQDDQYTTHTDEQDAAEHLINDVGKGVIAGHNLAGLIGEAGTLRFNQGRVRPISMMIRGYDYMRWKGQVLPNQDLAVAQDPKARQPIQIDEISIIWTPTLTHEGERRAISRNFRLEAIDLPGEVKKVMMAQHWYPEIAAQGLGVSKVHLLDQNLIPIFLECDKSTYELIPAQAGDLVRTRLRLLEAEDTQAYANAETFITRPKIGLREQQVASQEGLLLEFFPREVVFPTP